MIAVRYKLENCRRAGAVQQPETAPGTPAPPGRVLGSAPSSASTPACTTAPREAAGAGSCMWGPACHVGPRLSSRLLAVHWLSLSCGGHLESEPAEDRFVSVGLSDFHVKTIRHKKPLGIQDVSGLLENGEQPSVPSISSPRIPLHLVPPPPRVCIFLMFWSTQGPWTYLGHRAIHLLREEGRPASL